MRRATLLATLLSAVRQARDDVTARHDGADSRAKALEAKVDRLAEEISGLADATRAVLLASRETAQPDKEKK